MKWKALSILSSVVVLASCGMDPYRHDEHYRHDNQWNNRSGQMERGTNYRSGAGGLRRDIGNPTQATGSQPSNMNYGAPEIHNINNVSGIMPSKGNPAHL